MFLEWTQLSSKLPIYSGTTYTRWGRSSCPSSSSLIYKGQMTGKTQYSAGGGSGYQCLPDDPEYNASAPTAYYSSLRGTAYRWLFKNDHRVPCAVCETQQRLTQLMIPAKTNCPSSDWTLEYQGYLVSQAEHDKDKLSFLTDSHFSSGYVCIDGNPTLLTSTTYPNFGSSIYVVSAECTGWGALHNCPPYKENVALSCVVCSKWSMICWVVLYVFIFWINIFWWDESKFEVVLLPTKMITYSKWVHCWRAIVLQQRPGFRESAGTFSIYNISVQWNNMNILERNQRFGCSYHTLQRPELAASCCEAANEILNHIRAVES